MFFYLFFELAIILFILNTKENVILRFHKAKDLTSLFIEKISVIMRVTKTIQLKEKKMNSHAFVTSEKLALFYAQLEKNKKLPGPLMPTLHDAQHIFGHIPLDVQKIIAKELNESIAKINGVVTFYGNFSVTPKGKKIISVCMGTACYVRGSQNIMETLQDELKIKPGETSKDGEMTLCATRCIGACGLAPVFSIDDHIHGNGNVQKVKQILKEMKAAAHETK
jgi:NADH:ubiquinone oxidoreductase subunit E